VQFLSNIVTYSSGNHTQQVYRRVFKLTVYTSVLWTTGFQVPAGATMKLFSLPPRPDRLWGPLSFLFNGYRGSYSKNKAARVWGWPLSSI